MRHFTLARIRQAFPSFNIKPITEADFWRACKKFKIIVRELPLDVDGYHERKRGRYYILINSRLRGRKWLHTALHEFCHFLFDVPGEDLNYVFYRRPQQFDELGDPIKREDDDDPRERFADAFSTICFLPFPDLLRMAKEDLTDDPESLKLCSARIAVLNDYGI